MPWLLSVAPTGLLIQHLFLQFLHFLFILHYLTSTQFMQQWHNSTLITFAPITTTLFFIHLLTDFYFFFKSLLFNFFHTLLFIIRPKTPTPHHDTIPLTFVISALL